MYNHLKKPSIKVMKVILERMIRNLHIFELDCFKETISTNLQNCNNAWIFYSFMCTGKS